MNNTYFKVATKKPVEVGWMTYEEAIEKKIFSGFDFRQDKSYLVTDSGKLYVTEEDVIIQGVKGELYPCKKEIFYATYDY